jgi:hypothetical protein
MDGWMCGEEVGTKNFASTMKTRDVFGFGTRW